uniref:FERM domain-containing protein n=1 Tax=Sphenodon punctatus TaxID=8508 RepID=A0A8D0GT14_SPHPU
MVRPVRQEEYIHDYLLEDSSVALGFRRLTWKVPLRFENEIYTDLHYSQVLQDYLEGKLLLHYNSELEQQVASLAVFQHWARGAGSSPTMQELMSYTPQPVVQLVNPQIVQTRVTRQLQNVNPLGKTAAKIRFIEHVTQMPFFGYNVYTVQRIRQPGIPTPCFVGVNWEQMVVADDKSQTPYCVILLKDLQKMRTLQPIDDTGVPGLEMNYGSAEDPKTLWFELHQAKELYHTIAVIIEEADTPH